MIFDAAALYGSLAAPKYMQTLYSGSQQHSAAANSALCSGSLPYAAALLQHSQTGHSGNLTMQRQLGSNHVQVMLGLWSSLMVFPLQSPP
jgi:hypothetical protein